MEDAMYEILGILLIPTVALIWGLGTFIYKAIAHYVYKAQSKPLFKDAVNHGIRHQSDGKQYRVKKGVYDEYILTDQQSHESFIMSEKHLWECLRKRRTALSKKYSHENSYYIITYDSYIYNPI